ncbi:hypothetical protein PCYB_143410 [Plasmodium cynomolgi strain B]|uniref:Uncharacterized protein n=1 Tax=Plasmodium cynomolgi (strain B) TaxID=1120755 RepID=K6UMU7_PLACD|nr:hypothetical protein PCYB_143410 [Plasmodium cynomolgi strain B]GAB68913.1 hypothetical protein PCYB_143410 [Plasmodium cynomolgi strain B]
MARKDNIWILCKFYCGKKRGVVSKKQEEEIIKILESSSTPLTVLIKEEFDRKATTLYGKIYKSLIFSRFLVIFANLRLRLFIIRTSNKFKQDISLLAQFVTLCDDYMDVQVLYIGVTLLKCKRFLKNLFIQLKVEENIPIIMK